jgi:hypothetical protein
MVSQPSARMLQFRSAGPLGAMGRSTGLRHSLSTVVDRSVAIPAWTDQATFSVRTTGISPAINTATATYLSVSRQATLKCFN